MDAKLEAETPPLKASVPELKVAMSAATLCEPMVGPIITLEYEAEPNQEKPADISEFIPGNVSIGNLIGDFGELEINTEKHCWEEVLTSMGTEQVIDKPETTVDAGDLIDLEP